MKIYMFWEIADGKLSYARDEDPPLQANLSERIARAAF
jgi:hypothetical protein